MKSASSRESAVMHRNSSTQEEMLTENSYFSLRITHSQVKYSFCDPPPTDWSFIPASCYTKSFISVLTDNHFITLCVNS